LTLVSDKAAALVAAKDQLLGLASADNCAKLTTQVINKTDNALNLMKQTTYLPAPLGKWEVGYVDIMTEGPPDESSFIRLYYPTEQKHTILPERCPVWTEQDTKAGFINFLHSMVNRWPSWVNQTEFNLLGVVKSVNSCVSWAIKPVFSLGWGVLANNPKIPVLHQAQLAPNPANAGWPVVVFSHGMGCNRYAYSKVCYDLCSEGFVVAAVEHREGSACHSAFCMDGEVHKISHYGLAPSECEYTERNRQVLARAAEVSRALDLLHRLNEGAAPPNCLKQEEGHSLANFTGMFDMSQTYLAGHSFGGSTVLLAASKDDRFKGTVTMDPWMFPVSKEKFSVPTPVLMINTELFVHQENILKVTETCKELSSCVLKGAVHMVHTDAPLLFDNELVKSGLGMSCSRGTEEVLKENHSLLIEWLTWKMRGDA